MSECICSAATIKDWSAHSEYCPVYMMGRIAELEAQLADRDMLYEAGITAAREQLDAVRKIYMGAGCNCIEVKGLRGIKEESETCPMCQVGEALNGEDK